MSVVINDIPFNDDAFKNYIATNYDLNHDGILDDNELRAFTSLYISGDSTIVRINLGDYFPYLKTVELVACSALHYVTLNNSATESLTITGGTVLDVEIGIAATGLNTAIIQNCNQLQTVHYWPVNPNNYSTSNIPSCAGKATINVKYCNNVTEISCLYAKYVYTFSVPQLSTLDLRGYRGATLSVNGNESSLTTLKCSDSTIESITFGTESALEYVDLSNSPLYKCAFPPSPSLREVHVENTNLAVIDIKPLSLIVADCTNRQTGGNVAYDKRSDSPAHTVSSNTSPNAFIVFDSSTLVLDTTGGVLINSTNFPDSIFRQFVKDQFDTNHNDVLSDSEISNISQIQITSGSSYYQTYKNISSIQGIEYFQNLQRLVLQNLDSLSSVDVSEIASLTNLYVSYCQSLQSFITPKAAYMESCEVFFCETLNDIVLQHAAYGRAIVGIGSCPAENLDLAFRTHYVRVLTISNTNYGPTLDLSNIKVIDLNINNNEELESLLFYTDSNENGSVMLSLRIETQSLSSLSIQNVPYLRKVYLKDISNLTTLNISGCRYLTKAYEHPTSIRDQSSVAPIVASVYEGIIEYATTPYADDPIYGESSDEEYFLTIPTGFTVSTDELAITTQPVSKAVTEGSNVSFSVTASGTNLGYIWYYSIDNINWTSLSDTGTQSGSRTATFTISNVQKESGGYYRCFVYNGSDIEGGIFSKGASLTVKSTPPTITKQPANQTVVRGDTAIFAIAASGYVQSYRWEVSYDNGATWENYFGSGANTPSISIEAYEIYTGYRFRCKAINDGGTATSNSATLTVENPSYPPEITTQPVSRSVVSGNSATFTVEASGNDLSYQWQMYRNGSWYNISGATSANYTVSGTDSLNNSQYHCIVTNSVGSVISDSATLTVTPAVVITTPMITTQPQSVTVQEGSAASFRVAASGGGLSYQWQVNNGGTWYDVSGATNAAYNFKTVLGDNGKQYRCVVSNAAGTVTSNAANLTVTQRPDQPTPITPLPSRYKYYMIDGVDILPYIIEKGIRWSRNDVDGENAGRVIGNAEMNRDRLAIKMRCDISCRPLYDNEASIVLRVIEPEFVTVQYYDPMYGNVTKIMYSNNGAATQGAIYDDGVGIWDDITFPLIEK